MAEEKPKPSGMIGLIWDTVSEFFALQFKHVWAMMPASIVTACEAVNKYAQTYAEKGGKELRKGAFAFLIKSKYLNEDDLKAFDFVKTLPFPQGAAAEFVIMMMLIGGWIKDFISAAGSTYRQDLNKEFSPNVPSPEGLVAAAFLNPKRTADVREAMGRAGYSAEDIDLIFMAANTRLPESIIMQLYHRGVYNQSKTIQRLKENGLTVDRATELMKAWPVIPGVQDLMTMAVREAFTPAIAEKFGQYEDFPAPVAEYGKQIGLTEDWAKRYWAAHWTLPSLSMGYEMLHRNIIDEDTLKLLMRAQDVMPYWREKLEKLSFNPYTRVDVRRMYNVGVLTEEEVLTAYQDIGYNPEKAQKMTEFTVRYQATGKKDLAKTQIIEAYDDMIISRQEATDMLLKIGYDADEVGLLLDIEDYNDYKTVQADYIDLIKTQYVGMLIEELEARNMLQQLNIPTLKVDSLLSRWTVHRKINIKLPSKTDLDKMFKAGVINGGQWTAEMRLLGYNEKYTNMYIELMTGKK